MQNKLVAVLLAAGHGRRFGGDKLLATLPDGTPVALAAARNLRTGLAGFQPAIALFAIVRPDQGALTALLEGEGFQVLRTADAERGMGASLAAGVAAAADAQGWIVALADMPWLKPATIASVAGALQNGATIAAPVLDGQRGHPVGFSQICREELLQLDGDEGARSVLARHPVYTIECDDAGVLRDVDRPEDLR